MIRDAEHDGPLLLLCSQVATRAPVGPHDYKHRPPTDGTGTTSVHSNRLPLPVPDQKSYHFAVPWAGFMVWSDTGTGTVSLSLNVDSETEASITNTWRTKQPESISQPLHVTPYT